MNDTIHVFLGTKAQYIKTAPVIRELDRRGIAFRLIDAGQHAAFTRSLRRELGIREPDVFLGSGQDVTSVSEAAMWSARLAGRTLNRDRLRREVFGDRAGICVIHGDTPSTFLAAVMARRAGLKLAHLEAGLRSYRLLHPFPEEIIRIMVMRMSHLLFAPDAVARDNLLAMRVKGEIITTDANTTADALLASLGSIHPGTGGAVVAACHRVENLKSKSRLGGLVQVVTRVARTHPVVFVLHPPTRAALEKHGHIRELEASGVELRPLLQHAEFLKLLTDARFVIADGGSIQEECAIIGVPALIWRDATERPDGLGRNVVLSHYDTGITDAFLQDPEALRHPVRIPETSPSIQIADALESQLARDQ